MVEYEKLGKNLVGLSEALDRFSYPSSNALDILGAVMALAMSLLIAIDIIWRNLVGNPISGSLEYTQFLLSTIIFGGMAYTLIKKAHMNIDLFINKMKPTHASLCEVFSILVGLYFSVSVTYQSVAKLIEKVISLEASDIARIPLWPFVTLMAVGFALLTVVLAADLLRALAKMFVVFKMPVVAICLAFFVAGVLFVIPALGYHLGIRINYFNAGLISLGLLMLLMILGVPIAFAMGAMGIVSTWFLMGGSTSMGIVQMAVFDTATDYFFSVIPLFTLMGFFCFEAGISKGLYEAAYAWFGSLRGGLAIASIFACGGFAAISGDSMATAATMGSVALPEMKKYGYDDGLATGALAAGGTLGILIPPSMAFIIYGVITEQSVGKLFMAGVIPGLILTVLFSLVVFIRANLNHSLCPSAGKIPFSQKFATLKPLWPVLTLFALVMGGLWTGFFTPTEAGGAGAVGALIIYGISKNRSVKGVLHALRQTVRLTTMIFAMLIGVNILAYFIGLSEVPMRLPDFIISLQLSKYVVLVFIGILYLLLGMFMNIIPMVVLTLPIIFPSVIALGFDPIWFGVTVVILIQLGQVSPPVGINCFVIKSVAKTVPLEKIFIGVTPFALMMILTLIVLTIWPVIALIIPNSMETLAELSK